MCIKSKEKGNIMHRLNCTFANKIHVIRRVLCNDGAARALAKDIGKMFNESNLSKAMGRYKNPNLVTMVNPDLLDTFTNNECNSNLITLSNVNDYIAHKQDKVKYITVRAFLNEHLNDGFLTEQNASLETKTEIEPTSNEDDKIDLHISECALNMKERCLCFLDHKIPFGYDRTGHIVFRGLNLARALGYTRPDNALLEHTKPNMHVTTVYNIPTPTPSTQVGCIQSTPHQIMQMQKSRN